MTTAAERRTAPNFILQLRRLWLSPIFLIALTLLLALFTTLHLEVVGALLSVWLIILILVTSDDVFATTVPFLLLTVLVSSCYDGYALFIPYLPMVAPVLAALLFHFIYYRGQYSIGASFGGLLAVSVATALGGVGVLSARAYFRPAVLYYVLGLGFGMLGLYLLLRAQLKRKRTYDVRALLLYGLYLAGLYAVYFTLFYYAERLVWMQDDLKIFGHLRLISIQNRNVYGTYLILGLPAPFYLAQKKGPAHLLGALPILLAMMLTGSRGGLLAGGGLFILCMIYLFRRDKKHRVLYAAVLGVLAVAGLAASGFLLKFYSFRFEGGFIVGDEPRVLLLRRAVQDFLAHPVFGVGLGYTGNADIYDPKMFAMNWYHMMIPQIVAGLGILGTLSYLLLFWQRFVLTRKANDALSRALALCYAGLFLMSQVNPGEFCPMPYTLVAVMIFLFLEVHLESEEKVTESAEQRTMLSLLRRALWQSDEPEEAAADYAAALDLARKHMVFGVASEGLGALDEDAIPTPVLMDWQDSTVALLRQNEGLAAHRRRLCSFLKKEDIPAMILKGDSVARLYPTPDLRVAGDIDCLLREEDLESVGAHLSSLGFEKHEKEGEHHVAYKKGKYEIELHRSVSGIPEGEVGEKLTALLADTLDTRKTAKIGEDFIPVADDFHQALILLLHMQQHMREGGLGLRQVTDWALFVAKDLQKDTHARLLTALDEAGLLRFAETLTLATVRHLGLPAELSPFTSGDAALADTLFADFTASGNFGKGNDAYAGSGVVTLHRESGASALRTALINVSEKCKAEWTVAKKHPVLLLFFVPFWILRRLLSAKGRIRPLKMLGHAGARGKLYDSLALFENTKTKD